MPAWNLAIRGVEAFLLHERRQVDRSFTRRVGATCSEPVEFHAPGLDRLDLFLDGLGDPYRQQSLDLIQRSGLSTEFKDFAKLADHYNLARVALAKGDTAKAKAEAEQYMSGAEATQDVGRIRLGHELAGTIALREGKFDEAVDHLAQADQQDPYILYTMATAYKGKGDAAKAKEFAKRAADMHILPTIRYALVRAKAMKMG